MGSNKPTKKVKKPLETTLGKAPCKPKEQEDDISHLRKPIQTNVTGLKQILSLLENATSEVKNYVMYECDIMYECKVCRTIYRSLANFILHKRNYCKQQFNPLDYINNNSTYQEKIVMPEENASTSKPEIKSLKNVIIKLHAMEQVREEAKKVLSEDLSSEIVNKNVNSYDTLEKNSSNSNNVVLEKIDSNSSAVFQTLQKSCDSSSSINTKNVIGKEESTKAEVMEIHKKLANDVPVLDSEGKVTNFTSNKQHQNFIFPKTELNCIKCKQKFSTRKSLNNHIKCIHNPSRIIYVCPTCKDTFANPWCVYRHLLKVHRMNNKQVKRMREQVHNSWIRRGEESSIQKKKGLDIKEEVADSEKQWINDIEGDNDFQMCAGCGKHFDRKAALHSHSQMCAKRIDIIKENAKKKEEEEAAQAKLEKTTPEKQILKGASKRKGQLIRSYGRKPPVLKNLEIVLNGSAVKDSLRVHEEQKKIEEVGIAVSVMTEQIDSSNSSSAKTLSDLDSVQAIKLNPNQEEECVSNQISSETLIPQIITKTPKSSTTKDIKKEELSYVLENLKEIKDSQKDNEIATAIDSLTIDVTSIPLLKENIEIKESLETKKCLERPNEEKQTELLPNLNNFNDTKGPTDVLKEVDEKIRISPKNIYVPIPSDSDVKPEQSQPLPTILNTAFSIKTQSIDMTNFKNKDPSKITSNSTTIKNNSIGGPTEEETFSSKSDPDPVVPVEPSNSQAHADITSLLLDSHDLLSSKISFETFRKKVAEMENTCATQVSKKEKKPSPRVLRKRKKVVTENKAPNVHLSHSEHSAYSNGGTNIDNESSTALENGFAGFSNDEANNIPYSIDLSNLSYNNPLKCKQKELLDSSIDTNVSNPKGNVKRRLRSHSMERKFSPSKHKYEFNFIIRAAPYMKREELLCIPCNLTFKSFNLLLWHMSAHFSWFRFQCSKCTYITFNKYDCLYHARKHHKLRENSASNFILPLPNWKTVLMSHEFRLLMDCTDLKGKHTDEKIDFEENEDEVMDHLDEMVESDASLFSECMKSSEEKANVVLEKENVKRRNKSGRAVIDIQETVKDLHILPEPLELSMPANVSDVIKTLSFSENTPPDEVVVIQENICEESNDDWDIPTVFTKYDSIDKATNDIPALFNLRSSRIRTKTKQNEDFVYYNSLNPVLKIEAQPIQQKQRDILSTKTKPSGNKAVLPIQRKKI